MQQAITWANVDPDLCRHMVSLGHNDLRLNGARYYFAMLTWDTPMVILDL